MLFFSLNYPGMLVKTFNLNAFSSFKFPKIHFIQSKTTKMSSLHLFFYALISGFKNCPKLYFYLKIQSTELQKYLVNILFRNALFLV